MEDAPYLIARDGLPARKSGERAKRKHHYLRNYCGIATKSMKEKWRLVYVDVMAGPGLCRIKDSEEEFPGSPFVALDHEFAEYVFIEEDPSLAEALRRRTVGHAKAKRIKVLQENWVKLAVKGGLQFDDSTLAVAFVDPTGISQLPMSAIRKLARNAHIDMLVTIQYRLGIVWNAPQYQRAENHTALDAFLDWRGWREWDTQDPTDFGRKAIEQFSSEVCKLGFHGSRHVSVPEMQPLYRFTLFSRHPLADKFWNEVLKCNEKGQRERNF
jgi:three-Cys-motif partner protein